MTFVIDTDRLEGGRGWLNKKRNFKTLGYNMVGKCTNFKNDYMLEKQTKEENAGLSKELNNKEMAESNTAIEVSDNSYNETNKYIDLKNEKDVILRDLDNYIPDDD